MRIVTVLASGALLAGCAFAPLNTITETAADYNHAVETAKNDMFLLNVVRAKERMPMHFTYVSALRGNIQSVVSSGSLPIPFGGGPTFHTIYSGGPSINYTANPSFDVSVQDSKNFWLGITTPIPPTTMKYYLEQGWPNELVLFLFVRSFQIGGQEFINYPGSASDQHDIDEMSAFRTVLHSFFGCGDKDGQWHCDVSFEEEKGDSYGRPLKGDELGHLKSLVEVEKEDLKLAEDKCKPGEYQLTKKSKSLHLAGLFPAGEISSALDSAKQQLCAADTSLYKKPADSTQRKVLADPAEARKAAPALKRATQSLATALQQLCATKAKVSASLEGTVTTGYGLENSLQRAVREADVHTRSVADKLAAWMNLVQLNREKAKEALQPLWESKRVASCGHPTIKYPGLPGFELELDKELSPAVLGEIYTQLNGLREELSDMTDKLTTYCIGTSVGSGCDAKAFFRSPEALLYYLGEIVRHGRPEISVQYCSSSPTDRRPIFVVHQDRIGKDSATKKENAAVAVEYGGFQYTIERESNPNSCERTLTTETLTLVGQLFAQQTDASQAPATGAVTIVGPLPGR